MEDFEDKAREIMKEHGSPASLADYGYDQDDPIYFEDDVVLLLLTALSPPEGYVSREEMLSAMDRAFYDGMSKAEPKIPEGFVLAPKRPTLHMILRGVACKTLENGCSTEIYQSMLAARPRFK